MTDVVKSINLVSEKASGLQAMKKILYKMVRYLFLSLHLFQDIKEKMRLYCKQYLSIG